MPCPSSRYRNGRCPAACPDDDRHPAADRRPAVPVGALTCLFGTSQMVWQRSRTSFLLAMAPHRLPARTIRNSPAFRITTSPRRYPAGPGFVAPRQFLRPVAAFGPPASSFWRLSTSFALVLPRLFAA